MAKKKKSSAQEASNGGASTTTSNGTRNSTGNGSARKAAGEASTSPLIICRNKHWRYISSFHGPWLQLPPEVLESLAHSNWTSPRPHPIDPAVFYDVVKLRTLVDEATTLAVRAASGLTSAALGGSAQSHSLLGPAAALGMGMGLGSAHGGGQLSRERKHRMRELATGKLAAAYRLDEVAASVATMQSASTLEDVAQLVLQRNPLDADARYVHFFHEKIPSRMMAQCTPLAALDALVADRPHDASALRTRALTRLFKDDFAAAARDLTDALAAARHAAAQHRRARGSGQLVVAAPPPDPAGRSDARLADDDQPSSLEAQLLFHRAGVYFTLACRHVHAALDGLREQEDAAAARAAQAAAGDAPTPETPDAAAGRLLRAESRKQLRQNAKRALRDYTAFLAHFDYTPGIAPEVADEFLRRYTQTNSQTNGSHDHDNTYDAKLSRLLEESSLAAAAPPVSEALTPYRKPPAADRPWPKLPPPPVYTLNQLFDAVPPPALPPFPPAPQTPPSPLPRNETLTYHPLLLDALHSLLLVHALLQTPPKEHLRHAHNAARLVRLLDGYPIFLAARSPARGDWLEVLRRGGNWLGLSRSWDALSRAAPPLGSHDAAHARGRAETPAQRRERHKHEAILEALADDRVVDEESFQRAVRAREKRLREDDEGDANTSTNTSSTSSSTSASTGTGGSVGTGAASGGRAGPETTPAPPQRWATPEAGEYHIGTERADAIARWVRDAPPLTADNHSSGRKKKKKKRGKAGGAVRRPGVELEGVDGEREVEGE